MVIQVALNTTIESIGVDVGYAVRDGDGGQAGAIIEGIVTDAGHTVGFAIICDRLGNDYDARI